MKEKINRWMIDAYVRGTMAVDEFKSDEQGLSGVVVAVLLILVAVLAITALWGSLSGWLGDLWGDITGKTTQGMQGSATLGG